MSKKKKEAAQIKSRDAPKSGTALCSVAGWDEILVSGYVPLSRNPQIIGAVKTIANTVATISIHLMENTDSGDRRITNGLSRLVDIDVNPIQTRFDFMSWLVRTLFLEGHGNAVIFPKTSEGIIEGLYPIPYDQVSFLPMADRFDYQMQIGGRAVPKEKYIHLRLNPDPVYPWKGTGYNVELKEVAASLNQAAETKKKFMQSKYQPTLIIKVDGMTSEFDSPEGRSQILEKYIETQKAGEPWLIPADGIDVTSIKPLTLNDLAIRQGVELDSKTVAAILNVPKFLVGAGDFNRDEWNSFVKNRIPQITEPIAQQLTKSLLISPSWYFRFNHRSLMNWDLNALADIGVKLKAAGCATGDEVRELVGLPPAGLKDFTQLENYIPTADAGNQKKLDN